MSYSRAGIFASVILIGLLPSCSDETTVPTPARLLRAQSLVAEPESRDELDHVVEGVSQQLGTTARSALSDLRLRNRSGGLFLSRDQQGIPHILIGSHLEPAECSRRSRNTGRYSAAWLSVEIECFLDLSGSLSTDREAASLHLVVTAARH